MSRVSIFASSVGFCYLLAGCGGSAPSAPADASKAGTSSGGSAGNATGGSTSGGAGAGTGGSSSTMDGVTLSVTPSTIAVRTGDKLQFGATLTGADDKAVTWAVQETDGGTITGAGEYTAPMSTGTFHVTATSVARPALKAAATVNVSKPITELKVGEWTDVTPLGVKNGSGAGVFHVGIAKSNPAIVYIATDKQGLWKTTDSAKTWTRLGNPDGLFTDAKNEYLEDPSKIAVNPDNPDHLYVTEGVDGGRNGFWVSMDGGATFRKPDGFVAKTKELGPLAQDVVQLSTDPANFKHLLISPHSDWEVTQGYSSGILESTDGGETWKAHMPPDDKWANGTKGVFILHNPQTQQGDASRWVVADEGAGFWLTKNAGASWEMVSDAHAPHGGTAFTYTDTGALYAGTAQGAIVSQDNGQTWKGVPMLPATTFTHILSANGLLWAHGYSTEEEDFKFKVSTDGMTWTEDTSAGITRGSPSEMDYDPVNSIIYSCNRFGGIWALRVK